MKRVVIALIASALALVSASASAGFDVTVAPRYAPEGASESETRQWTPRPASIVSGSYNITVDATASSSLKEFRVSLVPDEQQIPPLAGSATVARTYSINTKSADTIQVPWDSNSLTPHNGYYKISSFALSHGTNSESNTIPGLKVNNPPLTPSGVRALLEEETATITWRANPEVDLTGYRVYRSVDDSSFKQIGVASGTRYTDNDVPKGVSLRYQLVAVRRSVVTPEGATSPPTKPTSPIIWLDPGTGTQPTEIGSESPQLLEEFALAPTIKRAPIPDRGFAPVLPFGQPIPARSVAAAQQAGEPLISAPARVIRGAVYKPPFIAAALLLLVISLHLLRLGRLLWADAASVTAAQAPLDSSLLYSGPLLDSGGSQLLARPSHTDGPLLPPLPPVRRSPLVWVRSRTTNLIGFPWKSNSSRSRLSKKRSQGTAGRPVANNTKVGGATEA